MAMPQMPNIPGAGVMTDTLDFVKNLWGSMGVVPGIAAPTLSVDELDKKINDLKAVEAWLNLNSSMVRGSIQALEVQRNTIATLKSMGKTLADAVQQPGAAKEKSLFESIPYASAFFQHAADALSPSAAGAAPAGDPFRMAAKAPAAAPAPAPAAPATEAPTEAPAAKAAPAAAAMSDAEAAAAAAAPMVNAAAWWNLLQEQFKQAVTTAMTTDVVSGAAARATEAASKFAAAASKPVAKADKGNLPAEQEQDKPAGKKANGNGSGKNGAATDSAARKAPARKAASAKPGKE
ncbi:PhaM family polyhydroxyalkanoate granule multifunctional regulatory protein [Pseudoduganella sp. UC29_71]|uniref:PhaM family polyhydroxyalkanoate granule multifunctional regulatory protein n=1 Tax=Pseudoduganella sp. UC29_71 TaxID=3350174 RepID=UPI0036734AB8